MEDDYKVIYKIWDENDELWTVKDFTKKTDLNNKNIVSKTFNLFMIHMFPTVNNISKEIIEPRATYIDYKNKLYLIESSILSRYSSLGKDYPETIELLFTVEVNNHEKLQKHFEIWIERIMLLSTESLTEQNQDYLYYKSYILEIIKIRFPFQRHIEIFIKKLRFPKKIQPIKGIVSGVIGNFLNKLCCDNFGWDLSTLFLNVSDSDRKWKRVLKHIIKKSPIIVDIEYKNIPPEEDIQSEQEEHQEQEEQEIKEDLKEVLQVVEKKIDVEYKKWWERKKRTKRSKRQVSLLENKIITTFELLKLLKSNYNKRDKASKLFVQTTLDNINSNSEELQEILGENSEIRVKIIDELLLSTKIMKEVISFFPSLKTLAGVINNITENNIDKDYIVLSKVNNTSNCNQIIQSTKSLQLIKGKEHHSQWIKVISFYDIEIVIPSFTHDDLYDLFTDVTVVKEVIEDCLYIRSMCIPEKLDRLIRGSESSVFLNTSITGMLIFRYSVLLMIYKYLLEDKITILKSLPEELMQWKKKDSIKIDKDLVIQEKTLKYIIKYLGEFCCAWSISILQEVDAWKYWISSIKSVNSIGFLIGSKIYAYNDLLLSAPVFTVCLRERNIDSPFQCFVLIDCYKHSSETANKIIYLHLEKLFNEFPVEKRRFFYKFPLHEDVLTDCVLDSLSRNIIASVFLKQNSQVILDQIRQNIDNIIKCDCENSQNRLQLSLLKKGKISRNLFTTIQNSFFGVSDEINMNCVDWIKRNI
jgi:hypothetical protein